MSCQSNTAIGDLEDGVVENGEGTCNSGDHVVVVLCYDAGMEDVGREEQWTVEWGCVFGGHKKQQGDLIDPCS